MAGQTRLHLLAPPAAIEIPAAAEDQDEHDDDEERVGVHSTLSFAAPEPEYCRVQDSVRTNVPSGKGLPFTSRSMAWRPGWCFRVVRSANLTVTANGTAPAGLRVTRLPLNTFALVPRLALT